MSTQEARAPVVWRPQPRQAEFMRRPEPEALYGGAAGGGKSDALVIEALRQVHIPHYRALILRKTYPQLSDLVDKSQMYYRRAFPEAQYNATSHVWVFPSGAKIWFGSMQYTKDRTNYQGKAYDFIGFDELTHFEWDEYSYMMSRNRPTGPGTRVYMRATTNPGGIGHGWVKARFITPAPPGTPIVETVTVRLPDGTEATIPAEHAAAIYVNEQPAFRVVCTPALLPQLALGRLLTEGWIASADEVEQIAVCAEGAKVQVYLRHPLPTRRAAAQEVAASLTNSRLTVTVEAVPWDTFIARLQNGQFDLYYGECRLTADWDVSALVGAEGSLNYSGYESEYTQQLLQSCRTARDNSRSAALTALWRQLLEDVPFTPVCFKSVSVLTTAGVVEGLTPTETNPFHDLGSWVVDLTK